MKVRANALAWALNRLPPATHGARPVVVIRVLEFAPMRAQDVDLSAPADEVTENVQQLVFKLERFGRGHRRWLEYVLEVA